MARNIVATVSQAALLHNLQKVRQFAPSSKIMAMVKANAYGHGLATVAKVFEHTDALGVASIEEALVIRKLGVKTDVVLIEGIFRSEELPFVQSQSLTQVVHHWPQIEALRNYTSVQTSFKVWLKINTGMNRLGFSAYEAEEAYRQLLSLPHIELMGVMTHFSHADDTGSTITLSQIDNFSSIVKSYSGARCLANSAGILAWPTSHADWVRPGLLLYGASPFANSKGEDFQLLPAMTLRSEIIAIRDIQPGDKVGYAGAWENRNSQAKIGIVAMGYGDGYPWHAKNGTPVLVNGQRTPTVGRISMDMLAVDLSFIKETKVGDPVILWGEGLPIEEVASYANTIPYELFCRFTERVTVKLTS